MDSDSDRCVTNDASVTAAVAAAGYKLFQQAYSQQFSASDKGVFLSPLSIIYALALAVNGAGTALPFLALPFLWAQVPALHARSALTRVAALAGYQSPTQTELLNAVLSYPGMQASTSSAPPVAASDSSAPVPCESDLNAVLGQFSSLLTSGGSNSSGADEGNADGSDRSGAARFILANSVWTRDITLRPKYVEAMHKIYNVSSDILSNILLK